MKRSTLLVTLGAAVVALYPPAAGATRFGGVVVAKQPQRHVLVVASRTGAVRTVRTSSLHIRVGSRVVVNARLLRDGTFRASRVAVHGRARRARIRAVVVRRLNGRKLVSAGHSVFSIRTGRLAAMSARDDGGDQPGDEVDETVTISPGGGLDEENEQEVGHENVVELEGSFVSLNDNTLTIKTEEGSTIPVVVPAGFALPTFAPGQHLELKVSVSGTTFTLVKVKDEDDQGADNNDQGDDGGGADDG
jgi:hypothetical protein